MLNLRPEDIIHKSYLNRLLIEVVDNPLLSSSLAFKGGTCAEMLGFLNRFSVDLDFDVVTATDELKLRNEFHKIFGRMGLILIRESDSALFFQLRYANEPGKRSIIRASASSIKMNLPVASHGVSSFRNSNPPLAGRVSSPQQVAGYSTIPKIKANEYKVQYLPEIDRLVNCQTIETMFANKLVAITDRYDLHKTIAGRDIYDAHHFFVSGYKYKEEVIVERTGLKAKEYLIKLIEFIKVNVTQTIINEDLNSLLPADKFQQIRKVLIPETLSFLARDIEKTNA